MIFPLNSLTLLLLDISYLKNPLTGTHTSSHCIFSSNTIEKMPRLNVDKLIQTLRSHCARLHEIYVDTTNIQISERLMTQIIFLENLLAQLETINV